MRWHTQTMIFLTLAAGSVGCAATNPNIDPRADTALHRMSDTLAKTKCFTVHVVATMEERLASGQLAQFSRDTTVSMRRPDALQANIHRGSVNRRIWHQGKDLTVLDVGSGRYATVSTPESVDEMLDFLADEYGIVVPSDDLLYANPYQVLTENVKSGIFVDQQTVDKRVCDHLLFTQDNVDWQIWIDAGDLAVPRRVVITYKDDPDRPQYEGTFSDWKLDPAMDSSLFTPQLPKSASRVEMSELVGRGEK